MKHKSIQFMHHPYIRHLLNLECFVSSRIYRFGSGRHKITAGNLGYISGHLHHLYKSVIMWFLAAKKIRLCCCLNGFYSTKDRRRIVSPKLMASKMKKFNIRGMLDGLRQSVGSSSPKSEAEIEENLRSEHLQVCKVSINIVCISYP